jgi:AraC-like DNA-binding protein
MSRPDHHNEMEMNLVESGWLTYLLGGRKIRIEPGRLTVFWAAIPHQILEFGDHTKYYVATIPFAWFLQWKLPERLVQPMLHGEALTDPSPAPGQGDSDRFAQWEDDLRSPRDETRDIVLLEMEARLMRMAVKLPDQPALKSKAGGRHRPLPDGGLKKVERMACLIAQRYTEPLTVESIGKAVGLHPNYAMSLFKNTFGTTLIDYLTHHRVSHAQRLLATTDMKIVNLAFESGFNSISRFNEAFRRACGCSPRDYRLRHELGEDPSTRPSPSWCTLP